MIWVWSIVILVSLLVEIITVGNLISIWFSISATITLVLALLGVSDIIQILTFTLISAVLILSLRPLASSYFRGNITATNVDALVGKHVTLTKGITTANYGEVKIGSVIWNTISIDGIPIDQGTLVSVIAIDGSKLVVRTLD